MGGVSEGCDAITTLYDAAHTREEVMEQQRRLDKAAGRNNPYLGLSFSELKKIRKG